jgi:ABC-type nitrate/sulfonate/bicarbonate transport system substrate-binding protein
MLKKAVVTCALAVAALLPAAPSFAVEVFTIGSIADPGYDSALWAIQNGKVKDPSIEVKITALAIPSIMQAVMTQQYNVVPTGIISVPQLVEQGVPIRIVGTIIRYHPAGHSDDLWVKGDSPYKTPQDLKGKTIGVNSVEAQNVISIRALLGERYGMNPAAVGGDFRWVEIPSAQFDAALQSGRVDAVTFSNVAAYTSPKNNGYRSVLHGSKELLEMYGGPMTSVVNVAYQADLDKRPQAYIALFNLLKASAAYAMKNQDEVFNAVAPKYKMTPADLKTWFTTYAVMPYALGPTDKTVFKKSWESGIKLGILKKAPDDVNSVVWSKAVYE